MWASRTRAPLRGLGRRPKQVLGGSPNVHQREAKRKKESGSEANPDGELPQRLIPSPPPSCSPKRSPYKAESGQHTFQPTKTGRPAKRAVCPFPVSSPCPVMSGRFLCEQSRRNRSPNSISPCSAGLHRGRTFSSALRQQPPPSSRTQSGNPSAVHGCPNSTDTGYVPGVGGAAGMISAREPVPAIHHEARRIFRQRLDHAAPGV